MKTLKIIVSGGDGQLGKSIKAVALSFPEIELYALSRADHDITDLKQVRADITSIRPDYYVNTAAYTAVDKAERNRKRAYAVNEQGVSNIATVCREFSIPLIHISTDYVYHNGKNRPLLETDPTRPRGIYAASKKAGEEILQAISIPHLIFRVSWIYSRYGNNFVKTMLSLLQSRKSIDVVYDQVGCPCWAEELARDILTVLRKDRKTGELIKNNTGIYNYTQLGTASWYDIVMEMREILRASTEINAVSSETYGQETERPAYSLMNLEKFRTTFDVSLRHWKEALRDCIKSGTNGD